MQLLKKCSIKKKKTNCITTPGANNNRNSIRVISWSSLNNTSFGHVASSVEKSEKIDKNKIKKTNLIIFSRNAIAVQHTTARAVSYDTNGTT